MLGTRAICEQLELPLLIQEESVAGATMHEASRSS